MIFVLVLALGLSVLWIIYLNEECKNKDSLIDHLYSELDEAYNHLEDEKDNSLKNTACRVNCSKVSCRERDEKEKD